MAVSTIEIFIGILSLIIGIYFYLISNYDFWKKRGVNGPKPIPIFGTMKDFALNKYSFGCYLKNVYDNYRDEPLVGVFSRREPALIINDLDLIKTILIKDFSSFTDRGIDFHEKSEPLTAHLFNLEPKRWQGLRKKLSPAFTSGKLREMFYLLRECANQLDSYLVKFDGKSIDMRDITAKFTTDVIGVCAFGLQANALADDDSTFRKMGKRIFVFSTKRLLKFRIREFLPYFYDVVYKLLVDHELTNFFIKLTVDTIAYRESNNVNRHDFVDLLRSLKEEPSKAGDIELTDSILAAQLFVFFVAGFETSSSTIANTLRELALNPEIRDKLRREIKAELAKTNGEITYEGIKEMQYLDKVVKEVLRLYPAVPSVMRKSTTPYTFPGEKKVSIPAGVKCWIPIFGIQRDEKYFPNPNKFDPERFSDEAVKTRHPMTFLSFGDGPRNCIGARFGSMQTKVGLVKILENYTVDICDKTDKDYKIHPRGFLLTPQNGVFLKITKTQ